MYLVDERPHNQHGSTTFVTAGSIVFSIDYTEEDNRGYMIVEWAICIVTLISKPPYILFLLQEAV